MSRSVKASIAALSSLISMERSELPAIVVCVIRPWLGLRCRLRETRAGGDRLRPPPPC
jgi:hypothetical protein